MGLTDQVQTRVRRATLDRIRGLSRLSSARPRGPTPGQRPRPTVESVIDRIESYPTDHPIMLRLLRRDRDVAAATTGPDHRVRRRTRPRLRFTPEIDRLETRITPATSTWSGLGADNLWTSVANWDVAPSSTTTWSSPTSTTRPATPRSTTSRRARPSARSPSARRAISSRATPEPAGRTLRELRHRHLDHRHRHGPQPLASRTSHRSRPGLRSSWAGASLRRQRHQQGRHGAGPLHPGQQLHGRDHRQCRHSGDRQQHALGSSTAGNGTTVVSGATLEIRGTINTSEPVVIAGTSVQRRRLALHGAGNNVVQSVAA